MLASDGVEALEIIQQKSVDVVITDYFMPRLDGRALTLRLRSENNHLPIVAATAATVGDETQQLLDAGANAVMAKPFSVEAFCRSLDQIRRLENYASARKSQSVKPITTCPVLSITNITGIEI